MPSSRLIERIRKLGPNAWRRLSIPARLVAVSTCVLLLSSATLLYTSTTTEMRATQQELMQRLDNHIEFLTPAIAEQTVIGDYELIEQMLTARAQRASIASLAWIDPRGNEIHARGGNTETTAPVWFVRWTGITEMEKAHSISVGGTSYGRIVVRMAPGEEIDSLWNEFLGNIELLLVGTGTLIALILGVVNQGLRPLYLFAAGAKHFGAGDHSLRIAESGPPEMVATAKAFNTMADNLELSLNSLHKSNARNRLLATVVEQSRDGIVTRDLEGNVTSWNPGAEAIFKRQAEDMLGKPCSILLPEASKAIYAEVLTRIRNAQSVSFEIQLVAGDGAAVDVAVSASPPFDERGAHIGEINIIRDITEKKRAEEALFREQERARVTLDSIGDGVITADMSGGVEYLNPRAEMMTGWTLAQAQGRLLKDVFHAASESSGTAIADLIAKLLGESKAAKDLVLVARDGTRHAIEESAAPIRDSKGEIVGVAVAFRDVGESRKLAQQLSWQASHDALTGLVNRRGFERRLNGLVDDVQLHERRHTLLCLDLDQFKVVNDTCGHIAGDEMLRQICDILKGCLRESDTLARLGGDEFGILLEHCSVEQAAIVAEKLRANLADYRFVWGTFTFATSVSIGVTAIGVEGRDCATTLGAADAACYSAKEQGRNRVQVFRPDDADLAQRHVEMQWVSRITKAIADQRLRLWSQAIVPIAESSDPRPHVELLVRMMDEDGRVVPPMAFIPAAERYGLMPLIDRQVLDMAFKFFSQCFIEQSVSNPPVLSINLSGASINDGSFLDYVKEQFAHYPVPPQHICFEITETAAIANLSRATHFMTELKKIGCRFSLDDFGSGFSSFAYLKNLPVDFLKIDGGFVKDMASDPVDSAMVEAINKVGHVMGIKTIAEFVENDVTLGILKAIGVDFAQGFGVGVPQPVIDLLRTPQKSRQMRKESLQEDKLAVNQ